VAAHDKRWATPYLISQGAAASRQDIELGGALPQVDCAPDLTRNAVLFGRGAGKRVVKANGLRANGVKAKSVRAGGIQPPQEEDQRTGET
jgi:hypothetical protein